MAVLSTLYGAMLLSSMFLPPLLIRTLGCKWTIVAAMSCYVAFSLGNFYASWYSPHGARHQVSPRAVAHTWPSPSTARCSALGGAQPPETPGLRTGLWRGSVPSEVPSPPADTWADLAPGLGGLPLGDQGP